MSARASDPKWAPREELRLLGTEILRVDGPAKVTGLARYTHDVRVPGMLYARLRLHPHPRCAVREIDVEPARAVPGVVHAEVVKEGDAILYLGADAVLAVVAAETPEAAEEGARAVRVELEELSPPVVTIAQALDPASPPVGPRRRGETEAMRESRPGTTGDEDAALAALDACDAVVEATYRLPVQHHVCLETHGCVVDYRGADEAVVYCSTQAVTACGQQAAELLGLDASKVHVVTEHMGGGFGSKFDLGFEGRIACRVAKALSRPVHLMLTRPQEFLMAGNRSGSEQRVIGGATKDGTLAALYVDAIREGGQSPGSLAAQPYIYGVGRSWSSVRSVFTALDGAVAMRAPGHPQASFAMESIVDELAYAIGMDPLEFRLRNLQDEAWHRQLDRVAREIGWYKHDARTAPGKPDGGWKTGIGFAISVWGGQGFAGSQCTVRVAPDGSVEARIATQDLGTGSRTLVAAIVAEELGLVLADVTARIGDSALPPSVGSGGSITTGSVAPAVKNAAHQAREALAKIAAEALGVDAADLAWRERAVLSTRDPGRRLSWEQTCALLREPLEITAPWRADLTAGGVHGAQAARVAVDTLTGEVRVQKMVCVQDSGLVFNRLAFTSQVNGGMVQALSYGLLEARVVDPELGYVLSANLEDYKIAGMREMPEMVVIVDDGDERLAAIGMAEAPVIPGHGAIANAVFNACGARVRELPITPDKVLLAIAERG